MKLLSSILCALFVGSLVPARAEFLLKPNDVFAIAGDSITQQKIYTAYMEDYLLMCQPVEGLRFVQFGWGSERSGGFLLRIKSDVLPFKPTVVATCYGMNDGNYRPMDQMTSTYFNRPMQGIVDELKKDGIRDIILGSPGCVDSKSFKRLAPDVYNNTLDTLRGITHDIAQKNGTVYADLHTPMMDVMAKAQAAYGPDYVFIGGDGIHPGPAGHLVMAYAFLKALGCDGAIGTITVDLAANQATGTPGQKVVSCENGTVTLESTRYPFCFQGDPDKPANTTASVLKFFPFNDDLNRYMLIVKGIKGTKAKVTWGKESKEFAAADLEKGINLAAEFLANPFSAQFAKVDAAVQAQQALETSLVQQYLHNVPAFKDMAPNDVDSIDRIAATGMKKTADLFDAAKALVVPVQHGIKVEPEP
ncbi:MAG: SGNH/GDSL hydrolase family protein [Chthoniobacteraceae bacterium]